MNSFPILMSWLVASALSGSAAIVLLLVLRPLIRRWLGARAAHALWLVVLVRLLIPWTPHTPMAVLPGPPEDRGAMDSVTLKSFVVSGGPEPMATPIAPLERRSAPGAVVNGRTVELVWLAGVVVFFGISLAGALRAAPLVRRAREIAADSNAMQVLASLPMSVRGLRILETDELKSPALCGFIRPAILLPPGWAKSMTSEELRCVLLHEIGHHRRGDVVWRWMFLLARAFHWFNPLVWIADLQMRIDQEMACDEWVLAQGGGIDSQKYGEALLRACRNLTPIRISSPGHATMAESSAGLAQRIRHIARMKTPRLARIRSHGCAGDRALRNRSFAGSCSESGERVRRVAHRFPVWIRFAFSAVSDSLSAGRAKGQGREVARGLIPGRRLDSTCPGQGEGAVDRDRSKVRGVHGKCAERPGRSASRWRGASFIGPG